MAWTRSQNWTEESKQSSSRRAGGPAKTQSQSFCSGPMREKVVGDPVLWDSPLGKTAGGALMASHNSRSRFATAVTYEEAAGTGEFRSTDALKGTLKAGAA